MNPYSNSPYGLGIGATNKAYGVTGFSSRGRPEGNHDRELALANLHCERWRASRKTCGDEAQGFLFSKPMPAQEFREFIRQQVQPVPDA